MKANLIVGYKKVKLIITMGKKSIKESKYKHHLPEILP